MCSNWFLADQVRDEAKEAIGKLTEAGIKTVMLTGDNEGTAAAVSKQVGLTAFEASLKPVDKVGAPAGICIASLVQPLARASLSIGAPESAPNRSDPVRQVNLVRTHKDACKPGTTIAVRARARRLGGLGVSHCRSFCLWRFPMGAQGT